MTSNLERYREDLDRLVRQGVLLLRAMVKEKEPDKEDATELIDGVNKIIKKIN